jgi:hypothetical protein
MEKPERDEPIPRTQINFMEQLHTWEKGNNYTFALKTVSESNVSMDLELSGMTRCRRQTKDTY